VGQYAHDILGFCGSIYGDKGGVGSVCVFGGGYVKDMFIHFR